MPRWSFSGHSVVSLWSSDNQVIDLSTLQRDNHVAVAANNFSALVMGQ